MKIYLGYKNHLILVFQGLGLSNFTRVAVSLAQLKK